MKKKKNYSLLFKSTFILILLIFPLNLLCLFTAELITKRALDSLEHSVTLTLNSQMNELDSRITTTNTLMYTFPGSDPHCLEMLAQKDDWHYSLHRIQVYKTLQEHMILSNTSDVFLFYMKDKDDMMIVTPSSGTAMNSEDLLLSLEKKALWDVKWHLVTPDDQPYLIWLRDQNTFCTGAVIQLQPILDDLISMIPYDSIQIFFSDSVPSDDRKILTCSASPTHADIYLNCQIDEQEVFHNISVWQKILYYILILYLLLLPVLYILFRRHVTFPLNVLNCGHKELENGNETYRIQTLPASKDFETAYESFNAMADTLQHLRLENINRELAAKQLQLSNLQLQIRPHFLLNTMNLLYTLIQNHEEAPAQEMILYLANYFRYMFRSGNNLSMFDREMALIREYLHISTFHYPDAFDISYQIDPCVSMVRVPSLLLHNFVENIISHSLVPGQIVHIVFFAQYEDQQVTIQISDDGRGISPEDVEMINRAGFSDIESGQHVGIRNSVKRLRYYYGNEASLTVESSLNEGATFTINFPYDLEEELL